MSAPFPPQLQYGEAVGTRFKIVPVGQPHSERIPVRVTAEQSGGRARGFLHDSGELRTMPGATFDISMPHGQMQLALALASSTAPAAEAFQGKDFGEAEIEAGARQLKNRLLPDVVQAAWDGQEVGLGAVDVVSALREAVRELMLAQRGDVSRAD